MQRQDAGYMRQEGRVGRLGDGRFCLDDLFLLGSGIAPLVLVLVVLGRSVEIGLLLPLGFAPCLFLLRGDMDDLFDAIRVERSDVLFFGQVVADHTGGVDGFEFLRGVFACVFATRLKR